MVYDQKSPRPEPEAFLVVLQTLAWMPASGFSICAVTAAVGAGGSRNLGLRELNHHGFSGEKETGDRGCVLECRAGHLGRVDDAGLNQVLEDTGVHALTAAGVVAASENADCVTE